MTISEPTYCSNSVEKTTTPPTMKTGGMSTTNNSFDKKEGQLIVYLMIAGSIMALIWNRNNVDAWLKLTNQFIYSNDYHLFSMCTSLTFWACWLIGFDNSLKCNIVSCYYLFVIFYILSYLIIHFDRKISSSNLCMIINYARFYLILWNAWVVTWLLDHESKLLK